MKSIIISCFCMMSLISCISDKPKPIELDTDSCEFCKMTISNGKHGAELITNKGRYYKFDDLGCMIQFVKSNSTTTYKAFYVNNYGKDNTLIPAETAHFIQGGKINSPMRGNFAAFNTSEEQNEYGEKFGAKSMTWTEVYNSYK